jgi:subtilisin-like proprotein convertase family protein
MQRAAPLVCLTVILVAAPFALAGSHTNPSPITINDADVATPYPATITVSGEGSSLTNVTVTLTTITHTFPDDLDILLVNPTGGNAIIMSDACGQNPAGATLPLTLTFDDAAAVAVPDTPACVSTSFRPANYGTNDSWPDPAPLPSGNTALSGFNGKNPNGVWKLYIVDDEALDTGQIVGGWTLNMTSSGAVTAVAVREFRALPHSQGIALYWRTASESNLAGFNVYRSSAGKTRRLNRELIRAARSPAASRIYRLVDTHVRSGSSYTYRLQVANLDGTRVWYGSSSLTAR